jgi:hypothetical protein
MSLLIHRDIVDFKSPPRARGGTDEPRDIPAAGVRRGRPWPALERASSRPSRAQQCARARTPRLCRGYDNERMDGHVVRKINPAEAAVVRRISDMYADGSGYRHIAHTLNAQHVATPRAQRGNPSGWDMGTVKAVIERQLYRGIIEYKKTRKRDKFGRKKIAARPTSDLITVEAPHLRIVSEALAAAVDERRAGRRERYLRGQKGQLLGKPVLGKYLLSGLLVCRCGARFEAQ